MAPHIPPAHLTHDVMCHVQRHAAGYKFSGGSALSVPMAERVFLIISEPTANAEGVCVDLKVPESAPSSSPFGGYPLGCRRSPSAFAVGMLRKNEPPSGCAWRSLRYHQATAVVLLSPSLGYESYSGQRRNYHRQSMVLQDVRSNFPRK